MKGIITENFLLQNETAVKLYYGYAKSELIFDYHCHLSAQEILDDITYKNITEVWLSGDHYKWRLMRACGIDEKFITGDATPHEKFLAWAATVEKSIGNPLYVWTHLELKRYFGVDELLSSASAERIWNICNEKLSSSNFSARGLILQSKVAALCTTDDPTDNLSAHIALSRDDTFSVNVLPAFRPEIALHPELSNFKSWVCKLSEIVGKEIIALSDLEEALESRALFFKKNGCLTADQSLLSPDFSVGTRSEAEAAFSAALSGEKLSAEKLNAYQTQLLVSLGRIYYKMGFVMQLHFGVLRNCNSRMFISCGPDSGFDSVGDGISSASVAKFFDILNEIGELPPAVIYSLNPGDNDKLASVLGCFQEKIFPQKLQLGAPWWFGDHRDGMEKQLKALANTGLISGFIGMLTDSRSFLSYTRHEYFRRVLCNLFGVLAESGEIPNEESLLGPIIKNICFGNAISYFGLKLKNKN